MASDITKEFILCAAIRYKGHNTAGYRHADCESIIKKIAVNKPQLVPANYGFLTSENRFVSRREAFQIAKAQEQIITESKIFQSCELRSEDLY